MGLMVFTVMAALAQMELENTRARIIDSVVDRRATGKDLDGRCQAFIDSQIRNALRLIDARE
jgi:DNA invertase Pin-like site-specific DNA recombinase